MISVIKSYSYFSDSFKYSTRKTHEKKTEAVEEAKNYLNSEILREP